MTQELRQAAWNVGLAAFLECPNNTSLAARIPKSEINLHRLDLVGHRSTARVAKSLNYLAALVRLPFVLARYDFAYIFCPGYCGLLAALWARLMGKPYGLYVRGIWPHRLGATPRIWRAAFRGARFIIATGEAFKGQLSIWNSKVVNEVPLTEMRPAGVEVARRDGRVVRLLFVGRLTATKGILDAVRALHELRAMGHPQLELLVAGGGTEDELNTLRQLIVEMDLAAQVTMFGHVGHDELRRLYQRADLFIFPSYFPEGFPRVLYEAMMYGLTIVTTAMPGLEGFLRDGENCLYCQKKDPRDIAQKIRTLIDAPELTKRLGVKAYADVVGVFSEFEQHTHGEQLLSLIASSNVGA